MSEYTPTTGDVRADDIDLDATDIRPDSRTMIWPRGVKT